MITFSALDRFLQQFKPILYRRKERIVLPGEEADEIYYILQGYVMQNILSANGNEFTPYIFAPRAFFPLTRLGIDKTPDDYDYEYTSLTPVEIYKLPKEELMLFLAKNPNTVLALNKQLAVYSGELLKKLQTRIFSNAIHMVVLGILDLVKLFGRNQTESDKKKSNQIFIDYWFTHQDIANISGLSREVVTKQMSKLMKEKLISYKSHFIVIHDLQSLKMKLKSDE